MATPTQEDSLSKEELVPQTEGMHLFDSSNIARG